MKTLHFLILSSFLIAGVFTSLSGQGYEQNLYNLQSASLITEVEEDTVLINSALNHFHLIGRHGEVLENILHTNNNHPDDIHIGESLLDMHPYPMPNGDIVFFSRKVLKESLHKSDVLYFNYRDGASKIFTVQTTIFLPDTLAGIDNPGQVDIDKYTFLNDHFYFSGIFHTIIGERYPVVMKVNLAGELVWTKPYLLSYSANGEISRLKTIETTSTARVLVGLEYADFEYYHLEIDEDGLEVGGSYFPLDDDLSGLQDVNKVAYMIQADGGLIIVGRPIDAGDDALFVFNANAELVFARPWFMGLVDANELYRAIRQVDGGFLVYYQGWQPVEGNTQSLTISKVDLAGDLVWVKTYVPDYFLSIRDIKVLNSGHILYAGELSITDDFFSESPNLLTIIGYLLKLGPKGDLYGSIFKGQTFEDIDPDCSQLVEAPLGGWLVAFESQIDTFYALSNASGDYERPVLPDAYAAKLYPPSEYWASCPPVGGLEIMFEDTVTHNFPAEAAIDCPDLVVNISAPLIRRCFESTYTVNYCNTGTIPAQNAYIEVELDAALIYASASIFPTSIQGQMLSFDIGDIDVGECGDFQITVDVGCDDVLLGQTHCTSATISPNTPCNIPGDWSGASLDVEGRCEGDSVRFTITNTGTNPTTQAVDYLVIEDQVILLEGGGGNLPPGDSLTLSFAATGAFYRIEVEQEPNHPGSSYPTASVEACTNEPGAPISLGFYTQYWEDDADHFVSIDCQENIGSYDPNDKRAYPAGVAISGKNYIEPNQRIDYHIRFQNTGTDTAFTVVIEDRIDPNLDLSSLTLEAASHAYSLEITPLRELIFTFNNIKLVDSFTNETLSHGFISFSIDQIEDLPEGTQINNQAAIFFDYNLPIYTNTWAHEIKQNILPYAIIEEPPSPFSQIRISPNPTSHEALIEVEKASPESELQLMIYDSRGMLYQQSEHQGHAFQFRGNGLPDGLYFIEIISEGQSLGRSKLIIQN
jgi:uncharacterized repeat protein (TIGR01451 family)